MKRLLAVVLAVVGLALPSFGGAGDTGKPGPDSSGRKSSTAAKVSEPETVGKIKLENVTPGMRVRLQLSYGRPFVGTVLRVTETMVDLDLSAEASGLPGKVRFRKSDITEVTELKKQTDEEKREVLDQRQKSISRIKIEEQARFEERQAEEKKGEETEETAQEDLRKALDVTVSAQQEEQMRALLTEFPPTEWGEEKFREIRENWILRDLRPTDKEARFLTVFKDWKEARDTVAILDARNEEKEGEKLLLKFPPSEGWGQARLSAILEKEAKGEPVTENETEFKKSYEAWSQAVVRRAARQAPPETTPEGEEEKPVEENPPVEQEKPAEKPPAETAPVEGKPAPPEKPAEEAPADEKQPPAGTKAPADEKTPDEVKPPAAEKTPADDKQPPAEEKPAAGEKTPAAPAEEKPAE